MHESGISVQMTKMHQVSVLHLIVSFVNNNNNNNNNNSDYSDYCNFV